MKNILSSVVTDLERVKANVKVKEKRKRKERGES